jgi:hypothetical protein
MNTHSQTIDAINQHFGLQLPDTFTEEEIIQMLSERVVAFLDKGPDAFFQLMYRLDISEKKLIAVLQSEHAPVEVARLIYQRQLQKIQSRASFKKDDNNNDPELKW